MNEETTIEWQFLSATVKQNIYASIKAEEVCRWGVDIPSLFDLDSYTLNLRDEWLILTAARRIPDEEGMSKDIFVKKNGGKVWKEVLEKGKPFLWEKWDGMIPETLGLPGDLFKNGGPGGCFPMLLDGEGRGAAGTLCVVASNGRGPINTNEKFFLSELGRAIGSALCRIEKIAAEIAKGIEEDLNAKETRQEKFIKLERRFLQLYDNREWRETHWGEYVVIFGEGDEDIKYGKDFWTLQEEFRKEHPETCCFYQKVSTITDPLS